MLDGFMDRKSALILLLAATILCCIPAGAQRQKSSVQVENAVVEAVTLMYSDLPRAEALLRSLNRQFPGNDAVNYYLGLACQYQGKVVDADSCLRRAVALDTSNIWYRDALAALYSATGRGAEAGEMYLDLYRRDPARYTSAYVLTLLADTQLSQYQDSLALENYEKALMLSPGYTPAVLGQSEVYRIRGNMPAYFAAMDSFVRNEEVPPYPKCEYVRRMLQYVDGNTWRFWHSQLDSLVNACVSTHPGDSSALSLAGSWYYGTGRKEEGIKYFDRYMEEYPEALDPHFIRLELLLQGGRMKDVLAECEEIVRLGGEDNPKVLPALSTIGDCWHSLGNDKKAFKAYDKVLKINPEYLPVLNNYAYYLSLTGKKLKKAERMSRLTVEKEPDNATFLDTYAWILHLMGRDKDAKPLFKHAMIYGGKDSKVILSHYAEVLEALGEGDLAKYYKGLADSKEGESE